jgi:hypothetical protein
MVIVDFRFLIFDLRTLGHAPRSSHPAALTAERRARRQIKNQKSKIKNDPGAP